MTIYYNGVLKLRDWRGLNVPTGSVIDTSRGSVCSSTSGNNGQRQNTQTGSSRDLIDNQFRGDQQICGILHALLFCDGFSPTVKIPADLEFKGRQHLNWHVC